MPKLKRTNALFKAELGGHACPIVVRVRTHVRGCRTCPCPNSCPCPSPCPNPRPKFKKISCPCPKLNFLLVRVRVRVHVRTLVRTQVRVRSRVRVRPTLIQSLKRQRSYLVSKLKSVEYNFEKLKESIDKFDERNQTGFPRFQSGQTSIGKMCVYRQLGNLP